MYSNLIKTFLILAILTVQDLNGNSQSNIDNNNLVGTKWYSKGNYGMPGDTLNFVNEKRINYFMSEVGFEYSSEYKTYGDTLTILTKTQALEVNDVSKLKPNLKQKYLIKKDTLKLIYLANKKNKIWEEAGKNRYKRSSDFFRIK
jgi:hypothetical protein